MTQPYAVVYFKDEKTYSEIAANWILSDNTSCWWPESKNIASLIFRKVVPNENGPWKIYDIEVIGFYGKKNNTISTTFKIKLVIYITASLDAARKKATESDCSSDDGDDIGKGLRKKILLIFCCSSQF
ncbi:unnamed protein product [Psylliodes chrysocephalus]|uniref:Uncharacterized protein n=1 Tax=Psylliodes chrysocephalus TaxID=3402493 RepID=A0A9P0D823_9CUCU|nr:unnamed protein product [Psylliodes chrysocephala]